jgi:hypothetical protein
MGKYANCLVTMCVKHDVPPRPGRSDTWVFGSDPAECGKYAFKDATCFVITKIITGNHMMMNGYPSKGAEKTIHTFVDGHTGGPYPRWHYGANNMYFFYSTDPNNLNDLGAHVEFHMGEGEDKEVFEFDEPRCIFVPKGVKHGPLYVTKFHRNFIIVDMFDVPDRNGCDSVDDYKFVGDDKKLAEVMGGLTPELIEKYYTETNIGATIKPNTL